MSASARLDDTLVSGLAWTALLRWSSQAISWVSTYIVARVLLPSDYGLVSMAMIVIGLVRMVESFGLDSVLVQDRTIVGERQARLAGLIVGIGVVLCALFLALAHPVATFFKEPQVASLVAALSLLFITDALQVVPRATLQRELEFRRLAIALFVQVLATQAALLACAFAGWGVWALVLNSLAGGIAMVVLLTLWRPYAIAWPRQVRTLAQPMLQGWRVLLSGIAYYCYSSSDQAVIGRFLGKDALGSYSFATTFANLPFQEASSVVGRVVPGIFSEVQNRRDELRRYFLILTEFLGYITLPMSVGLALTAGMVVHVVLGPKWTAVIVPLQILCGYAAFQGSQILIAHVLMWTGQFRALMWCSIPAGVLLPLGFWLSVNHGLEGIAVVWAVLYPLVNLPALYIGLRTVSVSFLGWLNALKPAAVGSLAMALAVLVLHTVLPSRYPELLRLMIIIGGGAAVHAAVLWFGFRSRVLEILRVVRSVRGNTRPTLAQA